MTAPLLSIITVTLNPGAALERTLASVARLKRPGVEYLIIDGGSTDGTVERLHMHTGLIDNWLSEADPGLYWAMNKGAAQARGRHLLFVNAGDELLDLPASPFSHPDMETPVVCGYEKDGRVLYPKCLTERSFQYRMPFGHNALITPRACFEHLGPYDTRLHVAADFDWLYRYVVAGGHLLYERRCIVRYAPDGLSDRHRLEGLLERGVSIVRRSGRLRPFIFLTRLAIQLLWREPRAQRRSKAGKRT